MAEKPTEMSYVTELVSVIKEIGSKLEFNADTYLRTRAGVPDIVLTYKGREIAVIEVKTPEIPLNDPDLHKQAMRYAEWYRREKGVELYGIHNMKYLMIFRYVKEREKHKTLMDYIQATVEDNWVPISDFPYPILPWVRSIEEYKAISTHKQAKENLEQLLLKLKEVLEGKVLDISSEVISALRVLVERSCAEKPLPVVGESDIIFKKYSP